LTYLQFSLACKHEVQMKKLIIWDFDGVIADSEKLWIKVWRDLLQQRKNLVLTDKQTADLLVGVSDKTKVLRLKKEFPDLILDDAFIDKVQRGQIYAGMHFLEEIPGVRNVIADTDFEHCIATGATKEQQKMKFIKFPWLEQYIPLSKCYTSDMVELGKPAPDLFLLAAKENNKALSDCVVIGDSLNDFAAAKAAGIKCIAFVGAEGNNNEVYKQKCLDADVADICATMSDLHAVLKRFF